RGAKLIGIMLVQMGKLNSFSSAFASVNHDPFAQQTDRIYCFTITPCKITPLT
ncbi:hypothetical protein K1T71_005499, partial [Dendrolimus kikuchii]